MRKTYYMDGGKLKQKSSRTNYRKKTEKNWQTSISNNPIDKWWLFLQSKEIDWLTGLRT